VPGGWVALAPRVDYPRLARSRFARPADELPVWSVVCFTVPSAYRGQGVAHGLLEGAIAFARSQDARALEAYPVDLSVRSFDTSPWSGSRTMFERLGFVEVAQRLPGRPVMRLHLTGS
jgi:GNAT superfamily N-acetyltransferase